MYMCLFIYLCAIVSDCTIKLFFQVMQLEAITLSLQRNINLNILFGLKNQFQLYLLGNESAENES